MSVSIEALSNQAVPTISDYFRQAKRMIDQEMGDGFSVKHPALLASVIQAAVADFNVTVAYKANARLAQAIECLGSSIERGLEAAGSDIGGSTFAVAEALGLKLPE